MVLHSEIKDFVKKVLLLWILLAFFVNLLFTYLVSLGNDTRTFANSEDLKFKRAGVSYLGTTGVAVSLNVGLKEKAKMDIPVNLYDEVLPISSVLADKWVGRKHIITSNMVGANEYLNILKTNVNELLDSSSDREAMLESFIDQLEYRYRSTSTHLSSLTAQAQELQAVVTSTDQRIGALKNQLSAAYGRLDYDQTEDLLNSYLEEKQKNTYARTYVVFLDKFISTYKILNEYNKRLLDTLILNKEALVKNVTVVLPDTGTTLMKKLDLLKTEAEWKSQ